LEHAAQGRGRQSWLHDNKHTVATRMAEAGVPESAMLALLGHTSRAAAWRSRTAGPNSVGRGLDGSVAAASQLAGQSAPRIQRRFITALLSPRDLHLNRKLASSRAEPTSPSSRSARALASLPSGSLHSNCRTRLGTLCTRLSPASSRSLSPSCTPSAHLRNPPPRLRSTSRTEVPSR